MDGLKKLRKRWLRFHKDSLLECPYLVVLFSSQKFLTSVIDTVFSSSKPLDISNKCIHADTSGAMDALSDYVKLVSKNSISC